MGPVRLGHGNSLVMSGTGGCDSKLDTEEMVLVLIDKGYGLVTRQLLRFGLLWYAAICLQQFVLAARVGHLFLFAYEDPRLICIAVDRL